MGIDGLFAGAAVGLVGGFTSGLLGVSPGGGVVTLPCGEREVSPPQELSGRCDCGPPRVHRRGAERAVRLG